MDRILGAGQESIGEREYKHCVLINNNFCVSDTYCE